MATADTLFSPTALRMNPLVTGWDEAWRATRIELASGELICGENDAMLSAIGGLPPEQAACITATRDAFARREFDISLPAGGSLRISGTTLVMGVINTTPDSFSDGGAFLESGRAVEHGLRLAEEGADILDVGGESTRPGASPVPADEERRRTEPVVAALARQCHVPVSIDTAKAQVASAALDAGASIVNDISALRDPDMGRVVAASGAALVLMHMQGEPRTMQVAPAYANVVAEVALALRRAMARAAEAGIDLQRVIVDPGIGFGKTFAHNAELLRRLPVLASLGRPILVGCSRKSLIHHALGLPVERRLNASLALNVLSILGRAAIIRVHDVGAAVEAARMTDSVLSGRPRPIGGLAS